MSTFDPKLWIEMSVVALVSTVVITAMAPLGLDANNLSIHPLWLPIVLCAARYGVAGLFASSVSTILSASAANYILDDSFWSLIDRAGNPGDSFGLVLAVGASWIGLSQSARVRRVNHRLERTHEARQNAENATRELNEAIEVLRDRCDRMDNSLTLWRSIAGRLEGGTTAVAAEAALELCAIRFPSNASVVYCETDCKEGEVVGRRGTWRIDCPRPTSLADDLTVRTALDRANAVSAREVHGVRETDSDLAIPVYLDGSSAPIGVIALRGIDPDRLRACELGDLKIVADWLSVGLTRSFAKPLLRAVNRESHT